jgi:hypothetical protein
VTVVLPVFGKGIHLRPVRGGPAGCPCSPVPRVPLSPLLRFVAPTRTRCPAPATTRVERGRTRPFRSGQHSVSLVSRAPPEPRHPGTTPSSSKEPPCLQLALKCPNQHGPRSLAFLLWTGIRAACPCVPSLRVLPVHGHKQGSRSRPRSATAGTQPRGTWLTNGVCSRSPLVTHPRTGDLVMRLVRAVAILIAHVSVPSRRSWRSLPKRPVDGSVR